VILYRLKNLTQEGIPDLPNREEWNERKISVQKKWLKVIGGLPNLPDTNMTVLSTEEENDHTRVHVTYESYDQDTVPAYLLIPKFKKERFPAVLALHPTLPDGKKAISLSGGKENRTYAYELVKKGYVVFAPDTITAGERIKENEEPFQSVSFYKKYPEWSAVGKMISDHQQALNVLCELEIVDKEKIGVIGHSLGGYNAIFLAAVDKRIKAIVCSCGFSTFTDDPELHRWGKRDWFSHIPSLSDDLHNGEVPFEWHEIAALAAPIPMFMWLNNNDPIFPHWEPIASAVEKLNNLYSSLGVDQHFYSLMGNKGHDFPPEIRNIAYGYIGRWLKGSDCDDR
jgi:dienelactone hydrolase